MNPKLLNTLSTPHFVASEWRDLMQKLEHARSQRAKFFNPNVVMWLYFIAAYVWLGLGFYAMLRLDSNVSNEVIPEIIIYTITLPVGMFFYQRLNRLSHTQNYTRLLKKWETSKKFRDQYKQEEEAFAVLNSICERLHPHLRTLSNSEIEEYLANLNVRPWAKDLLNEELQRRENQNAIRGI